jgi:xylulokinase
VWCQILADVTGRRIETIDNCQNAGTIGAAVVCGVGLGAVNSFKDAKRLIPVRKAYAPRREYRAGYDAQFRVFKDLYRNNRKLFKVLNEAGA